MELNEGTVCQGRRGTEFFLQSLKIFRGVRTGREQSVENGGKLAGGLECE